MIIHLMPSEIARLVLGYLRETDCRETAKLFVKESKHLTEYANGLKVGINYSTNINGKSLLDVINTYCCLQNKDNANQIEGKSNENKDNTELNRLSKQLTKIENLLNKLMQNSVNGQNSINQSNYRLIGSPPIISTSTPLLIKTIDMNSVHILSNQTTNQNENIITNTPSRNDYNSPRRKRTPRRRVLSGSSPLRALNSSIDDSNDHTLVNTSTSDQLRDETEPQLRIDINEPLVQPEFIVEELINFEPLHDVLAQNINKIFINSNNNSNFNQNSEQNNELNKEIQNNDQNIDPTEVRINDEVVNNILSKLESAPEFNTILDIITEKELQMTPYKNMSSVETTSSSASSLNTPQTPLQRLNAQKVIEDTNPVVKNLMTDLKTPEKTVTLYAARSPSEARITPIKVSPGKDYNFVQINDYNVPIIVPKVSLVGKDFELLSNSIVNTSNSYSVSVRSNANQTQSMLNNMGPSSTHKSCPKRGKSLNFEKPASELQIKRSELIPRKILPKPVSGGHNRSTTTITPVCADTAIESVNKPMILVNSIPNETNRQNEVKSVSQSPRKLLPKERNLKRQNPSESESTPIKILATDVRFPTVNILRKMNVNKMDQFLKQIHENKMD